MFYNLNMRAVLRYVESRNRMDSGYRYRPNDLYDLTVRDLPHPPRASARFRANKKPVDIGLTGPKARNTRHGAVF